MNREITINIWVDLYFLKRKSKTWHHKGMQLEWEKSRDQYEKKSRLNLQNNLRKASLGAFLFGSCNAERKNFFKGRRQ